MDKSCHSTGEPQTSSSCSNSNNNNNNRDQYLKQLNKLSHKISKPTAAAATTSVTAAANIIKKPIFDQSQNQNQNVPPSSIQSQPSLPQNQNQSLQATQQQHQQHQPPVYNINKSDFRDVVQKLTGSPAHERFSTPPPIHPPKPPSSRLQRIRPPPLVHVGNRPPPLMNCAVPPPIPQPSNTAAPAANAMATLNPNPTIPNPAAAASSGFMPRSTAPLSPLPPFPAVHAAAESPVSAYLRYLQNSGSGFDPNPKQQFSGFSPLAPLVSPRWNSLTPPPPQPQQQQPPPQPQNQQFAAPPQLPPPSSGAAPLQPPPFSLPPPTSPLAFGCLNSPRSPYHMLSPSLLFSPSPGQFGFPLSPTVPVPSPKWRGI